MRCIGDLVKDQSVITAGPDMTVFEVIQRMRENKIGVVPVVQAGKVVGIFSERDLLVRVMSQPAVDTRHIRLKNVMTHDPIVAEYGDSCEKCLTKMWENSIRHLPVLSDKKLVGIISIRDLLFRNLQVKQEELDLLNTFINFVPPSMSSEKKTALGEQAKNAS